jgi:hypothetical protein
MTPMELGVGYGWGTWVAMGVIALAVVFLPLRRRRASTSVPHPAPENDPWRAWWSLLNVGMLIVLIGSFIRDSNRAGDVLVIVGGALWMVSAVMALANWRGLLGQIAGQPRKTRYGALAARPPVVRVGAIVLLAASTFVIVKAALALA